MEGAAPDARITSCHVAGDHNRTFYLLPLNWRTDDQQALKRLLYEPYFKPVPPRPTPEALIAVEGFGSFRPAEVADPHHPVAQAIAQAPDVAAAIEGKPYRVRADGMVVAAGWETEQDGQLAASAFKRREALPE